MTAIEYLRKNGPSPLSEMSNTRGCYKLKFGNRGTGYLKSHDPEEVLRVHFENNEYLLRNKSSSEIKHTLSTLSSFFDKVSINKFLHNMYDDYNVGYRYAIDEDECKKLRELSKELDDEELSELFDIKEEYIYVHRTGNCPHSKGEPVYRKVENVSVRECEKIQELSHKYTDSKISDIIGYSIPTIHYHRLGKCKNHNTGMGPAKVINQDMCNWIREHAFEYTDDEMADILNMGKTAVCQHRLGKCKHSGEGVPKRITKEICQELKQNDNITHLDKKYPWSIRTIMRHKNGQCNH